MRIWLHTFPCQKVKNEPQEDDGRAEERQIVAYSTIPRSAMAIKEELTGHKVPSDSPLAAALLLETTMVIPLNLDSVQIGTSNVLFHLFVVCIAYCKNL